MILPIKKLVQKLRAQHGCSNPVQIAENLGFIIIDTSLVGVRGFYQYLHRCHIIYLDSSLTEKERLFVCAHELGHALLHKGINRIFLDTRTFAATGRYEKEADRFAACLLYKTLIDEWEGCTSQQIAENLKVSPDIIEWMMKP